MTQATDGRHTLLQRLTPDKLAWFARYHMPSLVMDEATLTQAMAIIRSEVIASCRYTLMSWCTQVGGDRAAFEMIQQWEQELR